MSRRNLGRTIVLALFASAVMTVPAAADGTDEPMLTFVGGGWGHGVGMSQYGALGRAEAGHTHEAILGNYYPGTTLGAVTQFEGFEAGGDVDVRVAVRSIVAISTPVVDGAPQEGWTVSVRAGGEELGTSTRPVTAEYLPADGDGPARWSARWTDAEGLTTELCDERCEGVTLTIELTGGDHVVIEEWENGDNIGKYGHGAILLHPAAVGSPRECGTGQQFCVVNADLTLDEYLYGLAEVPSSWPVAALRAQAVAGRSYAAAVMRDRAGWAEPFDLFSSVRDQAYSGWEKETTCDLYAWCAAVDTTSNQVVIHSGTIATTFYSSSNGGHSASPVDVWDGGSGRPYLPARPDPFDVNPANPNGRWEHSYPVADVSRWLNSYIDPEEGDQLHVGDVERIVISEVPPSGRINFAEVTIHGSAKTTEVRKDGAPYGYRFFYALRQGCLADDAGGDSCDALLGTKFIIIAFFDIDFDDYFYVPVQWMTAEGLTTGLAPNLFGPTADNSRAQIATFLWRFAGEPDPASPPEFADVAAGVWYEQAVAWLAESGITTGTSPSEFSPDATVNRAQAATFLWRFAGSPRPTVASPFGDVEAGRYYTDAVRWMVEWGITTGTSPTTFSPDAPLTRGQIATFLWRLAGQPGAFADGAELPDAMRLS